MADGSGVREMTGWLVRADPSTLSRLMRQQVSSRAVGADLRQLPMDETIGRGRSFARSRQNRPKVVVSAGVGQK